MNNEKKFYKFILLLLTILFLIISIQLVNADIISETSLDIYKIFYYHSDNPARENITFCSCYGGVCGNFPAETTRLNCFGDGCPTQECQFTSNTACKREGQYYVSIKTDQPPPNEYNCGVVETCGPHDTDMLYNVKAHYVNYDDNEAYCTTIDCGNGTWDPDAPGSYDFCVGLSGCGNIGSCCGDDPNDDPDMGREACANCPSGYNARVAADYETPFYRRYKDATFSDAVIPPNIGCCGDDMTEDCMLFGLTDEYLCFDTFGYRTSGITIPEPPPEGCEDPPWCYWHGTLCCPPILPLEIDPSPTQPPPYNTSGAYWFWGSSTTFRGLIFNVTCANYQTLASENTWISCNDFIINRDVAGRPTNEQYFSIIYNDGGLNNPQTIADVDGNHDYYCYAAEDGNHIIAECCGGNYLGAPDCLSDHRIGGAEKETGNYITAVKNPDFSEGLGTNAFFWTTGLSYEWTGDSLRFYNDTFIDSFTFSDPISVTPNQDYTITAKVYNNLDSGKSGIEVCNPDYSWCTCRTDSSFKIQDWESLSCSFTTPASVTSLVIRLITNEGATGEAYFDDVHLNTLYCAEDYSFTTDLDNKPEDSCNRAGYVYTGQYCCSEDDDVNEYYNDPEGQGACWNKVYQPQDTYEPYVRYPENGQTLLEVLVYGGNFYGCAIDNTNPNFNPTLDQNKPYEGSVNFVRNPEFEDGTSNYIEYNTNARITSIPSDPHSPYLEVEYTDPGGYISQNGIFLENGIFYTITFEAKTQTDVTIPAYDILKEQSGSGVINCGPFEIEEDTWKLFKCSGTWSSTQLAELVLETTQEPLNRIFYDNIRIYSSNDLLLTLDDQPNPGGNGPNKGQLITDQDYCTGFDIDSDGEEDYYCSYLEKWKESQGLTRNNLNYIAWSPQDPNTQKAECCAADSCWNGTECIPDQSHDPTSPAYPDGGDGYRCINGEWQDSLLKLDWNGELSGYCPSTSQCLVHPSGNPDNNGKPETYLYAGEQDSPSFNSPQCINNSQYILDHYCDNGKWTSRTKLLASDLLGLANNMGLNKYTLFCEDYTRTLNIYSYSAIPFGIFEQFLNEDECLSKEYQDVRCVNKICILKYNEGNEEKAIFSTTINVPINATQDQPTNPNLYLLSMFGKDPNEEPTYCQTAIDPNDNYDMCNSDDIWYNHKTESLIYNKEGISPLSVSSNPFVRFFRALLDFIQFWQPKYPLAPTVGIDISFIDKTKDFNKLYINVDPTNSIWGIRESVYDQTIGEQIDYIAINYTGFSTDICDSIKQFNIEWGTYYEAIVCNKTGNSYYVTTKDIDYFEIRNLDLWKQLTSELRVR